MTTTVKVERIDIVEGPNLEGLLKPWLLKSAYAEEGKALPGGVHEIYLRFDEVHFMDESGVAIEELGTTLMPALVAIGLLGGDATTRNREEFVITVSTAFGTFTGHYNTRSRKGSLLHR